jgi:hypothetical protein
VERVCLMLKSNDTQACELSRAATRSCRAVPMTEPEAGTATPPPNTSTSPQLFSLSCSAPLLCSAAASPAAVPAVWTKLASKNARLWSTAFSPSTHAAPHSHSQAPCAAEDDAQSLSVASWQREQIWVAHGSY